MKLRIYSITLLLLWLCSGLGQVTAQNLPAPPGHPRLLLLAGEEKQIQKAIAAEPTWQKMHQAILSESDQIIQLPPIERIQIGRRLLDKSREALRRLFHLSYAWRMTQDSKYAQRAEKEMLAIAGFSDWNPTHYLDVAEMTMAMAIGYDWLYPVLSPESKKTIAQAITEKGLNTSLDDQYNAFLRVSNNWNQVCNAGISFGALALYEDNPELSKQIIQRALTTIKLPMKDYAPDGAYPEGYSYWGYGTSFNVLFISAMEKAFGTDFGLSQEPGFLKTARYMEYMTGPSGLSFNYSDAGSGKGSLHPAMFWFAQKSKDPSLLWVEKEYLQQTDYAAFTKDRLLPAVMIWGVSNPLSKVTPPATTSWTGQGKNPVTMMRSSWTDPNSIYVGFKTGTPSASHGHMDVGSFVMESDGVRWAQDLGMQNYNSLESKGLNIWGGEQTAQRWQIKRYNNLIHNTLTVNDQHQLVKGKAKIQASGTNSDMKYAVSDLSEVYEGQLASAQRGIGIVKDGYVVVRDEVKATDKPAKVRWVMLTPAEVTINKDNTAQLTHNGKKLTLRVNAPASVQIQTWSTAPTTDYDAPNDGTQLVGFEYEVPAGESQTLQVELLPEKVTGTSNTKNLPLAQWGKK
ncbi:heparinase II/III domain-containing protein [Telluribacter humicola]|uniref:heparinase II/III domain-containing protein n=1 Tax=Telluribacter humicola TaxID=1720261 RepID=UPI001A96C195|nr:heparinase II/III family protein [Telluribacter humicola]